MYLSAVLVHVNLKCFMCASAILIWRQVDDTGQCRPLRQRDIVMHYLDCVSYKLLVFLRLQQELVSKIEPAVLHLPFQALQLIG